MNVPEAPLQRSWFLFCLTAGLLIVAPLSASFEVLPSPAGPLSSERSFEFTYRLRVQVPEGGSSFQVHVPLPQDSPWQEIYGVELEGPVDPMFYHDSKYGNRIVRYDFERLDGRTVTLIHRFEVHRVNRTLSISPSLEANPKTPTDGNPFYRQFLDHNRYVQTNQEVQKIARETTRGATTYRSKLRALYDRVRSMMQYDKSGEGWGRGDISYCLRVGKGNCTDFHTLFTSLAREQGIPARFLMGFPIPRTQEEGSVGGYHCWAEAYVPGQGWFPVDISEADKHAELVEFYFGTLDADRVTITTGKNIPLSSGKTVNYLVYPVVVGNDDAEVEKTFSFRNLPERGG